MRLKSLIFSVCFFAFGSLSAQSTFQRVYEINEVGDTLLHHLASTAANSGAFISILARQIDGEYKTIMLAKQDQKGNIRSQVEYDFGQDSIGNIYSADLVHNSAIDSAYFTLTLDINDVRHAVVGKFRVGAVDEFKAHYFNNVDFTVQPILGESIGYANIEAYTDTTNIHCISDDGVYISRLSRKQDILWAIKYALTDTMGTAITSVATSLDVGLDSLIYAGGILSDNRLFQLVVDSQSVEVRAKAYTLDNFDAMLVATEMTSVTGGNAALTGYYNAGGMSVSYVVMTDTIGDVMWAKRINIEGNSTEVYNITQTNGGEIVIAGKYLANVDTTRLFSAALDIQGNILWVSAYGPPVDADLQRTSLAATPDGGSIIAANGFNDRGDEGLVFVRQSAIGATTCSDTIIQMDFADLVVATDTLFVTKETGLAKGDTLAYEDDQLNNIIIPILQVDPANKVFCPNEAIMELLTATVTNVDTSKVEYLWSDMAMATTDTTRVFEAEMYMVTVTISDNTCYMMCDTLELSRSELPVGQITADYDCVTDEAVLTAGVSEGGTAPYTFLWNTGAITDDITVTAEATYSVMIRDACGDSTLATLAYEIPENMVSVVISENTASFCDDGTVTLTANVTSTLGGDDISYSWSTGGTSQSITVTEAGNYSVNILDRCGDMASNNYDLTLPEIFEGVVTLDEVSADCREGNANGPVYTITLSIEGEVESVTWVNLNPPNTFPGIIDGDEVELQNTNLDSITFEYDLGCGPIAGVLIDLTELCEEEPVVPPIDTCITFASIFFPTEEALDSTGMNYMDQTFGPVFTCGFAEDVNDVISNYEFKIFNRWGQEVYSTDNPMSKWDGRWNDDRVPSEAYIWYAKFDQDADGDGELDTTEPFILKGDVTVVIQN